MRTRWSTSATSRGGAALARTTRTCAPLHARQSRPSSPTRATDNAAAIARMASASVGRRSACAMRKIFCARVCAAGCANRGVPCSRCAVLAAERKSAQRVPIMPQGLLRRRLPRRRVRSRQLRRAWAVRAHHRNLCAPKACAACTLAQPSAQPCVPNVLCTFSCVAKFLGSSLPVAVGACVCQPPWTGPNCNLNPCRDANQTCSGHGRCEAIDDGRGWRCGCEIGFSGTQCEATCAGFGCQATSFPFGCNGADMGAVSHFCQRGGGCAALRCTPRAHAAWAARSVPWHAQRRP